MCITFSLKPEFSQEGKFTWHQFAGMGVHSITARVIQSMSVIWPERFVMLNFQSITRFWHLHRLRERPPEIGCLIIESDNFEKCVSEAFRRLHWSLLRLTCMGSAM